MKPDCVVAYLTVEMMVPEIPGFFRGGLGDLAGHTPGGLAKRCRAVPITYGYPRHWQTGKPINYWEVPGTTHLFNLDVDVYFPPKRFSIPVFGIDRGGAQTYLVCPPAGALSDPSGDILYPDGHGISMEQSALFGRSAEALLMRLGLKPDIAWYQEWRAGMTAMPSIMANPFFKSAKHLYTSHTSRPEALPKFPASWYDGLSIDRRYAKHFVRDNSYIDPDRGCIALADMVNGVSQEHGEVLRVANPEHAHKIIGVMNGVDRDFALSNRAKHLSDPNPIQLWIAHKEDKRDLVGFVNSKTNAGWTTDDFIVGLTRRLAWYKNQVPMFRDIVHNLVRAGMKVLIGGVAHEKDPGCQEWMRELKDWTRDPALAGNFVYIPEYNEDFRRLTAQGCDVWVECPWKRSEACGTGIFFAWINGNLVVATQGGGAKEHGTPIDADSGTGDCLYIEPYEPATLEMQLKRMQGWYNDWTQRGADLWPRLRYNAFERGKLLDTSYMMERYEKTCFDQIPAEASMSQAA